MSSHEITDQYYFLPFSILSFIHRNCGASLQALIHRYSLKHHHHIADDNSGQYIQSNFYDLRVYKNYESMTPRHQDQTIHIQDIQ